MNIALSYIRPTLYKYLFSDNKFVYLLTDAYLGGDLWRTLHARGN